MFPIDLLTKAARATPEAIAVVCGDRRLTYAALLRDTMALAAGLQSLSNEAQPRIGVLSPNTFEMFVTLLAIHAGGCVLVPLNPRSSRMEIDQQIAMVKPDMLVVDPDCADLFTPTEAPVVFTRGQAPALTFETLLTEHDGQAPRFAPVDPGAVSAIKFTGGSSGRPKAVVQSFRTTATTAVAIASGFDLREDDVYLIAAPMTHGAGSFILPILARGGSCVIIEGANPAKLVAGLEAHAATMSWMPPTLLYMLMDVPGVAQRRYALRHLIWSGAPATPAKLKQAQAIFGNVLESAYGQAEVASVATLIRAHEIIDESYLASVGRPSMLAQVEIMSPDGAIPPPGALGEIVVRSDLRMIGYLGMPELTAQTIVDGWVHTGDVGFLDARGYLFIKDRLRDVIISGGFNVYPSDVEAALTRHPAIREAVVFGLPDEK